MATTRRDFVAGAAAGLMLAVSGACSSARAQNKTVLTFAGATFAEAGRGDKLRAWVDKFNKSQDKIEVQPIAITPNFTG